MKTRYQLICISRNTDLAELDEAARLSGMHPEMIEVFLRARIVSSKLDDNGVPRIAPDGIERLCQIQHMRKQGRPVLRNIRLIFSLTDRLAKTECELRQLRSQLSPR
jgi:hypothetical protein